jgi:hypothetical protein
MAHTAPNPVDLQRTGPPSHSSTATAAAAVPSAPAPASPAPTPLAASPTPAPALEPPSTVQRSRHFVAGGVAGVASLLITHPLDTLAVWVHTPALRLAGTADALRLARTVRLRGALAAAEAQRSLSTITVRDPQCGWSTLYRGISVPLVTGVFTSSVLFGTFHYFEDGVARALAPRRATWTFPISQETTAAMFAGSAVGVTMSVLHTPREYLKTLMQARVRAACRAPCGLRTRRSGESRSGSPLAFAARCAVWCACRA